MKDDKFLEVGDLVRWRGCALLEFGAVIAVGKLGTATVRVAGPAGGRTFTVKKRLRTGYERFTRPITEAEERRLIDAQLLPEKDPA